MSTAHPVAHDHRSAPAARIGLVLAGALAVLNLATFAPQLPSDPTVVFAAIVALSAVCLVAVPFAWRGAQWARITVVVACVLPAVSGVPAFFIPGIPPVAVVAAAAGILLSLLAAWLVLRAPRSAD